MLRRPSYPEEIKTTQTDFVIKFRDNLLRAIEVAGICIYDCKKEADGYNIIRRWFDSYCIRRVNLLADNIEYFETEKCINEFALLLLNTFIIHGDAGDANVISDILPSMLERNMKLRIILSYLQYRTSHGFIIIPIVAFEIVRDAAPLHLLGTNTIDDFEMHREYLTARRIDNILAKPLAGFTGGFTSILDRVVDDS